jgi:hypothetical protein
VGARGAMLHLEIVKLVDAREDDMVVDVLVLAARE